MTDDRGVAANPLVVPEGDPFISMKGPVSWDEGNTRAMAQLVHVVNRGGLANLVRALEDHGNISRGELTDLERAAAPLAV